MCFIVERRSSISREKFNKALAEFVEFVKLMEETNEWSWFCCSQINQMTTLKGKHIIFYLQYLNILFFLNVHNLPKYCYN